MSTSINNVVEPVRAVDVYFFGNVLSISLNDGREIRIPFNQISWLDWLAKATPEQQSNWSIEPNGFAIYWEDLDDGLEICHVLGMESIS